MKRTDDGGGGGPRWSWRRFKVSYTGSEDATAARCITRASSRVHAVLLRATSAAAAAAAPLPEYSNPAITASCSSFGKLCNQLGATLSHRTCTRFVVRHSVYVSSRSLPGPRLGSMDLNKYAGDVQANQTPYLVRKAPQHVD